MIPYYGHSHLHTIPYVSSSYGIYKLHWHLGCDIPEITKEAYSLRIFIASPGKHSQVFNMCILCISFCSTCLFECTILRVLL